MSYDVLSKEELPLDRAAWRIWVPRGLKTEDLKTLVRTAAKDAYRDYRKNHGFSPGAVRIFASQVRDDAGSTPTAATGTLSKDGDWAGVADKESSLEDLTFTFEISELYTQPSIHPCKAGDVIKSGSAEVSVSETAEDWSTSIYKIPPGSDVYVLEVLRYPIAGQYQMFRLKVRHSGVEGWAHSTDFSLALVDKSA